MSNANTVIRTSCRLTGAALLLFGALASALAQDRPDPITLMKAQREAMATFAFMDGVWRGPACTVRSDGSRHDITQTERIGPRRDPVQFFEMKLQRVGDSEWPGAGAIPPR